MAEERQADYMITPSQMQIGETTTRAMQGDTERCPGGFFSAAVIQRTSLAFRTVGSIPGRWKDLIANARQ
jgi:hypothetical protein